MKVWALETNAQVVAFYCDAPAGCCAYIDVRRMVIGDWVGPFALAGAGGVVIPAVVSLSRVSLVLPVQGGGHDLDVEAGTHRAA